MLLGQDHLLTQEHLLGQDRLLTQDRLLGTMVMWDVYDGNAVLILGL